MLIYEQSFIYPAILTMNQDHCGVHFVDESRVKRAQAQMVDGLTATHVAELFAALGDPTRVRLVSALAAGELCVCDIAAALGMSQSAVSHQLRLLRTLKLAKYRRDGRILYYSIADDHVAQLLAQGLNHVMEEPRDI